MHATLDFPPAPPVSDRLQAALDYMATESGLEPRGAIFTRRSVVDFILDLAGYTPDKPLHRFRILEPAFGAGAFLLPVIDRLLAAWRAAGSPAPALAILGDAIRATEVHRSAFAETRASVISTLSAAGVRTRDAAALADRWLTCSDFLLVPLADGFDFVVGNPPYVRQELIPGPLLDAYRTRYTTMYDRADLYIPFIERSLSLLAKGGTLGFICADRWMKNRYGGPLRRMVAERFHLAAYVDMVDTPAFHSDVIAYPAVTIIRREAPGTTRIAYRPKIDKAALAALVCDLNKNSQKDGDGVREVAIVTNGAEPWLLGSTDQTAIVRRLESRFQGLEAAGCKVGIGVATGADDAFIGDYETLNVEPDRKLPLVTTKDIATGEVEWRGLGIVNPFADEGGLVNLADFPLLRRYLVARKDAIAGRHVARKAPANWYRTIDRIKPTLAAKPKLLIPDIKGEAHVVFERGELYPHHNLYYVTSSEWDLRALQAVLLSAIARLFVVTYSTRMRGGYLRFQAQYLRRIRLPEWRNVSPTLRRDLVAAATKRDLGACDRAAFKLYGLTHDERSAIGGNGD